MFTIPSIPPQSQSSRRHLLRNAVLNCFAHSANEVATLLDGFDEREWKANLRWLDSSGLALYLFDHLSKLKVQDQVPANILARLRENVADNAARNAGLLDEVIEISRAFSAEELLFAHVKGITLSPDSVPDPALRCQIDLDFLVDAERVDDAQRLLEGMGYTIDFKVGKTWEFRAGVSSVAALSDLYRSKPQRSTDLHLISESALRQRIEMRSIAGIMLPVLFPADQYISQAKHLLKHLCCAFTRAAWLLEFRRHTLARRYDESFWMQVTLQAAEAPQATLALGVASLLVAEIFGDVVPEALSKITRANVTPSIRLWITLYGRRALMADFPGTKVYLLLKTEVQAKTAKAPQTNHDDLLPRRLPKMIALGYTGESLFSRLRRCGIQLHYIFFRLRFHCVEGARYALEFFRFQRHLRGLVL